MTSSNAAGTTCSHAVQSVFQDWFRRSIVSYCSVNQSLNVRIDDRLVRYDWSEADELGLAYAISVHKAQGSEYPVVVIPVMTTHYMLLQRPLLYTAVTRARKLVVLVGTRRAIAIAVRNNKVALRNSGLSARLNE